MAATVPHRREARTSPDRVELWRFAHDLCAIPPGFHCRRNKAPVLTSVYGTNWARRPKPRCPHVSCQFRITFAIRIFQSDWNTSEESP